MKLDEKLPLLIAGGVIMFATLIIVLGIIEGYDMRWEIPVKVVENSQEYDRGYMDGFNDGMSMSEKYGTVRIEGGEE